MAWDCRCVLPQNPKMHKRLVQFSKNVAVYKQSYCVLFLFLKENFIFLLYNYTLKQLLYNATLIQFGTANDNTSTYLFDSLLLLYFREFIVAAKPQHWCI